MKDLIKNILIALWKPFRPDPDQAHLFIMGHPRSGSSLLMHILESNNEIVGFGEYFTKYTDPKILLRSEFDIRRKSGQLFKKRKYVVNQVNHQSVTPNLDVVINETNKHILILRAPEETLSSMIKLSDSVGQPMSQRAVTNVYVERLNNLMELVGLIPPSNWIFVSYHDLIQDPEMNLNRLTRFLGLKAPLKKEYKLKRFTQKWGDPSENITKGKIFKTVSEKVKIDSELLDKAIEVYKKTHSFLETRSLHN